MSSPAMSSKLLVLLCMVFVSLAIILQGVYAARDLPYVWRGNFINSFPVHMLF
jgi:hypothetical protein